MPLHVRATWEMCSSLALGRDEAAMWTKDMLDREYEDPQHVHRTKVDLGFDNKKRGPWYVNTLYKLLRLLSGLV